VPGRTTALRVIRPSQWGQAKPSTSKTLARRSAQCSRWMGCAAGANFGDRSEPWHRRLGGTGTTSALQAA